MTATTVDTTTEPYAFAVVVATERGTRRRIYMSLHSATRAAQRAKVRGVDASLTLVQLVPAGVIE